MTDDLDPIDPELGRLFEAERRDVSVPSTAKARGLARLEAALPAAAPPMRSPWRAGPVTTAFVVGGLVGAGLVAGLRPPRVVYVDRPAPSVSIVVPVTSSAPSAVPSELPAVEAPSATPAAPTVSAPRPEDLLAREQAILDVAHTALGRREAARALDAANRHAREFPRGQMTEEREAIAVQALVLLGRRDEAKARAERFRAHWPTSVFLPVVDTATAE